MPHPGICSTGHWIIVVVFSTVLQKPLFYFFSFSLIIKSLGCSSITHLGHCCLHVFSGSICKTLFLIVNVITHSKWNHLIHVSCVGRYGSIVDLDLIKCLLLDLDQTLMDALMGPKQTPAVWLYEDSDLWLVTRLSLLHLPQALLFNECPFCTIFRIIFISLW